MEQLSFKIAETEGPLDLILQLIRQHKLDIYDIEISKLLEQYMDYIQQWQETDMEIASEFLEMASRLVYIKSVSLLPKHEELEEKLKSELTGQFAFQFFFQFLMLWQQRNGFDVHKTRGHLQKLTGNFHIRLLPLLNVVHVLFQQFTDFNIVDIQFVLADQLQDQVQRAFCLGDFER